MPEEGFSALGSSEQCALPDRLLAWTPDPSNHSNGKLSVHGFKEGVQFCLSKLCVGRSVLVLTVAEKVQSVLGLVRSEIGENKIAGSLPEQEWLIPTLDFLVATPLDNLPVQSMSALFILIDGDTSDSFQDQAMDVIHRFFPSVSTCAPTFKIRKDRWFSPCDRVGCSSAFQQLLASTLPEAKFCPGWGDKTFATIMRSFSARGENVVCQDWSGLVALILGLVRHAFTSGMAGLLVAAEDKVHALTQLVQGCAHEMGISEERILKIGAGGEAVIRVESVGNVVPPVSASRIVILEADQLFDSGTLWRKFVAEFHGPVGLHVTQMTNAVKEVVSGMRGCYVASSPAVTMEGVCQFSALVESEEEKLETVCHLWEELQKSSPRHYSVFCNSCEKVDEVVRAMIERGYEAYPVYSQDDAILEEVYKHTFSVIVTNVYSRASQDVINYELPRSVEEYVKRVGRERSDSRRIKMVINVGTRQELRTLSAFNSMLSLPSDLSNLRHKLLVLSAPYLRH